MKNKFLKLTDYDLIENKFKYSTEQIIHSLHNDFISLRVLTRTQKLTPYICAKYCIFGGKDEKYADCSEDAWLDINDILRRQPHITEEDMEKAFAFIDLEEENEEKENNLMSKEDKYFF